MSLFFNIDKDKMIPERYIMGAPDESLKNSVLGAIFNMVGGHLRKPLNDNEAHYPLDYFINKIDYAIANLDTTNVELRKELFGDLGPNAPKRFFVYSQVQKVIGEWVTANVEEVPAHSDFFADICYKLFQHYAETMDGEISPEFKAIHDIKKHINDVNKNIFMVTDNLNKRAWDHDRSKLSSYELPYFIEYNSRLASSTYMSEEYNELRAGLKPALDHHYANNSHHPEHFENGIDGMSLLDLIEMVCDWVAAVKKHDDGDVVDSMKKNRVRFKISDSVYGILVNTILELYPTPLITKDDFYE